MKVVKVKIKTKQNLLNIKRKKGKKRQWEGIDSQSLKLKLLWRMIWKALFIQEQSLLKLKVNQRKGKNLDGDD